jgi:hypothetical protein
MNVARASFSGFGWSDLAFTVMLGGWCGAGADDLMNHGTFPTQGDAVMGGPTVLGTFKLSQNNYTETEREENDGDANYRRFIYSFPRFGDRADWDGRRICTATGMMAAGRDIVYVDGAPYIKAFAPKRGYTEKNQDPWTQ